ncbi:triose-phosphate isomerase [Psychroflexus salis]|uniref:Triosephosphate isomerase n=1 Tax=Psychroflexus salis TaxID=1526574 RepID=A0A917E6P7_9FLAO|nr:triose-phosphate isomerase [Psychroflexus salis]GGE05993.1 triosephosphate isomerase [Psychroflexus salis]
MRSKIVAGNWKMNCDLSETKVLLEGLTGKIKANNQNKVVVAPPFTNLHYAFESLKNTNISVAAQNINENESGAHTGEISAKMLKGVGVEYVIIGHSERRAIYKESDETLAAKTNQAVKEDFQVMFCVGEELASRKAGKHFDVVKTQLEKGLFQLSASEMQNIIIAYEPVWAIGTGETASPEQAQEMHAFIRSLLAEKYNNGVAKNTSILYGGSVKPNNAKEIFGKADVDGGLIGGASLKAEDFLAIIDSL